MKSNSRSYILFQTVLLICLSSTLLLAQKPCKIKATYSCMLRDDLTIQENKELAIRLAKEQALKNKFGEVLIQGNSTYLINAEKENKTTENKHLYMFSSESILNGKYLRDTEPPSTEFRTDENGKIWIDARITGIGVELEHKEPSFSVELASCPDEKCIKREFQHGEGLLVRFQSGEEGYLYIFLDDISKNITQLVFPVNNEQFGIKSDNLFKRNEEVWLFEGGTIHERSPYSLVAVLDGLGQNGETLTEKWDKMYFIVTREPIKTPAFFYGKKSSNDLQSLGEIPLDEFQKWLHKLRALNSEIEYSWELIVINR